MFEFFFGQSENLQHQYNCVGSGFIITTDGYLFSNWHVVANASNIKVTLADGRTYDAQLIGADTELDIALLKIEANNLAIVPLGNSDNIQVGDLSIAIGNPFGLSNTFTFGTINGLGRQDMIPGLKHFIQSDVSVNPGNSGSPLLNIQGQAIGINTAIRSKSGHYEGISFAIPINIALEIAEQLINSGTIERGFLGIIPQELDSITRKMLNLEPTEGVLISALEIRGPASNSGLKQGDIITKIDSDIISSPSTLTMLIASKQPNSTVEIEVLRKGIKQNIIVMLGTRPSAIIRGKNDIEKNDIENPSTNILFQGIIFDTPSDEELKNNSAPEGVLIKQINPDSPFAFILSKGDIVISINNSDTTNINSLKETLDFYQNTRSFVFALYKNGFLIYRSIEY